MRKYWLILIIILIIASFFRLWQLSSIPPGVYPDEAINANQAISEPGKIFYPENNGREGLYINLLALSFNLFGISIWSLKIVSAIIGILTVLGLYLLIKEIFKNRVHKNPEAIALLSAFFLAVSFWHVNFSRIAFRAILVPFLLVFSFYFLFRGFRTQKLWNFIIAGLFCGLGLHTYIAFRLAVLIFIPVLIFFWFFYKKQNLSKKYLVFAICFLLFAFIIALPIGIYFLQNPQDFVGRTGGVSIFSQENPLKEFGKSLIYHLAMFNIRGDYNWRHNFSGSPMLLWPIGILFLIGLFYSFKKLAKSIILHSIELFAVFGFLIIWWLIMLLPGVLTSEAIPHGLRVIGVIPVVYIFAGLGAYWLFEKIAPTSARRAPCGGLKWPLVLLILLTITLFQFQKYFYNWAKNPETENAFSKNYVEIGNYLNSLSPDTQKYVIVNQSGVLVNGIPMPAQTPMFIERTKYPKTQTSYLLPENINEIKIIEKGVVVFMGYDEGLFERVRQKFPEARMEEKEGFFVYKID